MTASKQRPGAGQAAARGPFSLLSTQQQSYPCPAHALSTASGRHERALQQQKAGWSSPAEAAAGTACAVGRFLHVHKICVGWNSEHMMGVRIFVSGTAGSLCAASCNGRVFGENSRACHFHPAGRGCCRRPPWQCVFCQKLKTAQRSVISLSQPRDAAIRTLSALQDEYADEPGTVIASDFYHSNELMPLSDEAIINRVVSNMGACEPAFLGAQVSTFGKAPVRSF